MKTMTVRIGIKAVECEWEKEGYYLSERSAHMDGEDPNKWLDTPGFVAVKDVEVEIPDFNVTEVLLSSLEQRKTALVDSFNNELSEINKKIEELMALPAPEIIDA
jgi:hypothetical protein